MAVVPNAHNPAIFELKSASLTLVAFVLKTADVDALAAELQQRFGDAPNLFDNDPVVIDLAPLAADDAAVDVSGVVELLRRHKLLPVAAKSGSAAQMEAARAAGLGEAPEAVTPPSRSEPREAVPASADAAPPPVHAGTIVIDRPLRSGQQVYARGGDLIVLAAVSFGAEVIADGHIHVYAPLRGRAIAGARGDAGARIFSTCMEPQLVSIAGTYRTTDTALPDDVLGRPAQVRLDRDKLVFEALKL